MFFFFLKQNSICAPADFIEQAQTISFCKRSNFPPISTYVAYDFETCCYIIFMPRRLQEKRQTMAYITDCNFSTATVRHAPLRTTLEFAHFHWSWFAIHYTKTATIAGAVIRDLHLTKIASDLNQ